MENGDAGKKLAISVHNPLSDFTYRVFWTRCQCPEGFYDQCFLLFLAFFFFFPSRYSLLDLAEAGEILTSGI